MQLMTKDIIAPDGGVMTDEVGIITGDLTLTPWLDGHTVRLRVQYKGAEEWYTVSDAAIDVDAADPAAVDKATEELMSRFD